MDRTKEMQNALDGMAEIVFGMSASKAQEGNICISCKNPAVEFKDELSKREYGISGMCQKCQDAFFGMGDE